MNDNKKLAFNSLIIFIRLCIVSFIGIFSSRIILDALGASAYGLYNVVGGIVTLLNVMNTAMLSTTYRYMAFEIGKKNNGLPNKVFNTCLLIHAIFAILILLSGFSLGIWYIDNYLNVPVERINDARFVLVVSLLTTSFSTLLIPYQGLLVAYERFAITAIIEIISCIIRFVAISLVLYRVNNSLCVYSIIQAIYTLILGLACSVICYKDYYSIVKLKYYRDYALIKEMMAFALWILFGAVAIIGKTQGCVILINLFFGTLVNAAYAIGHQIETYVSMFARSLNSAAVPQITKNFSRGNNGRTLLLTSYISKYTFIIMMIVAYPVIIEIDFILGMWLKEVPEGAGIFCRLILLNALIGCFGEGISALISATGNIKNYQIIFQTFNLLGVPVAYFSFKMGYDQYSILYVYIGVSVAAALLRVYLLKALYHFEVELIVKVSYTKIFIIMVPLSVFYFFYSSADYSVMGHICGLVLSELFLISVVILVGLDSREKNYLLTFIKKRIHNYNSNIQNDNCY